MRRAAVGALAATVIVLAAAVAWADEPSPAPSVRPWLAQPPAAPAPAAQSRPPWRPIAVFAAVAGLAGLAFYLRRRWQLRIGVNPQPRLRVLDTTRIGPKSLLVLTQVGGRTLLLGVTEQSVRRLAWIRPEDLASKPIVSPAPQPAKAKEPPPEAPSFTRMLRGLMGEATQETEVLPTDAASILARETKDVVETRPRPVSRPEPADDDQALEGQVSGLARRTRPAPMTARPDDKRRK